MMKYIIALSLALSTMGYAENTAVYLEQGGAKQVVASGGEVEVQSGGTLDLQSGSTLNNAAKLDITSGGEVEISSGATLDVVSGATFTNAAKMDNTTGAEIEVDSGAYLEMAGDLSVASGGSVVLQSGSTFTNVTKMDNQSGAEIEVDSGAYIELSGDMSSAAGASIGIASGVTWTLGSETVVPSADANGLGLLRVVRSEYDATVDGGVSGTTYDLGEDLPANAIVLANYFQIITQFVDDGSGTVAIQCASADDLYAAADISADLAGEISVGVVQRTVATMFDVGGSSCNISVVLGPANVSAGKLVHWVEYLVTE